jgi:hypothetical protein
MTKKEIFDKLWIDYTVQNPEAGKIHDLFIKEVEIVENDHIAFRTFNDPRVNIEVLSKVFTQAGYKYVSDYKFEDKHLYARHYEHATDKKAPRVFISELIMEDFSPFLQQSIRACIDKIPPETLLPGNFAFSGCSWGPVSYEVYQKLRDESEYAAWLYVHGYRANHFTVSVNYLERFSSLEKVNSFLKSNGFHLNDSGGEIKGTPAQLLEQSSTKAGHVNIAFTEGVHSVPACYYEFARRYKNAKGELFSGFIAGSADKIFESTDFYEKK